MCRVPGTVKHQRARLEGEALRCRANAAHTRQSRPDSGLGIQKKSLQSLRCSILARKRPVYSDSGSPIWSAQDCSFPKVDGVGQSRRGCTAHLGCQLLSIIRGNLFFFHFLNQIFLTTQWKQRFFWSLFGPLYVTLSVRTPHVPTVLPGA